MTGYKTVIKSESFACCFLCNDANDGFHGSIVSCSEKARMLIDGILTLPMVLPPTVMGFFLLFIFGVKRPVGKFILEFFGWKIVFTCWATFCRTAPCS